MDGSCKTYDLSHTYVCECVCVFMCLCLYLCLCAYTSACGSNFNILFRPLSLVCLESRFAIFMECKSLRQAFNVWARHLICFIFIAIEHMRRGARSIASRFHFFPSHCHAFFILTGSFSSYLSCSLARSLALLPKTTTKRHEISLFRGTESFIFRFIYRLICLGRNEHPIYADCVF